jgi:hypothetical protein
MLKKLSALSNNKSSLFLLTLALIVGGIGAQATGILNTPSGGYLVCVHSSTKVVTHPGTSTCPKGSKKLVLGAQGEAGTDGLTGAAGLPGKDGVNGKDGNTLWNGTTDPISTLGAPGDMFINSQTKTLFGPKNLDGTWPAGVSMVGPAGPTGAQGPAGPTGAQGPGGGSGPAGATGPAGSNATLTCAQGGTCAIGDTGPGGGIVFIVQTPTAAAPWRYMEAAPNTWSGGSEDPLIRWCSNASNYVPDLITGDTTAIQTSNAIGSGHSNSRKMLRGCTYGAANAAAAYNGGGKSDWHLPSKDELNELYLRRATVGGFLADGYWPSSEDPFVTSRAWFQMFTNGGQGVSGKSGAAGVRPVRAF